MNANQPKPPFPSKASLDYIKSLDDVRRCLMLTSTLFGQLRNFGVKCEPVVAPGKCHVRVKMHTGLEGIDFNYLRDHYKGFEVKTISNSDLDEFLFWVDYDTVIPERVLEDFKMTH